MEYIRVYRAMDYDNYVLLTNCDKLLASNPLLAFYNDSNNNSFDYRNTPRIHFFLYQDNVMYYSKRMTAYFIVEFLLPLDLCVDNLGVGLYGKNLFLELGIPCSKLKEYTGSEDGRYIDLNKKIAYQDYKERLFGRNSSSNDDKYAFDLYESASELDYRLQVSADDARNYFKKRHLILKKDFS